MRKNQHDRFEPVKWLKQPRGFRMTLTAEDGCGESTLMTRFRGRWLHTLKACTVLVVQHEMLQKSLSFHLQDDCWTGGDVFEGGSAIVVNDDAAIRKEGWLDLGLIVSCDWNKHLAVERHCGIDGDLRVLALRPTVTENDLSSWINQKQESLLRQALHELKSEASLQAIESIFGRYFPNEPDLRMKYRGIEGARIFQGGDCSPS